MKGFDVSHKILSKHGLQKICEDNIVWEIEPYNKEKYAGFYVPSKKESDVPRICFKPEIVPPSQYPYVILHELAHHIHYAYLTRNPHLEARWIALFNTSIRVVNISKETSQELLNILLDGDVSPSKLKSELDDDLKLAYTWVLRTMQQNHSISVRELSILLEAGQKDEIKNIWPRHTIKKRDLEPVITEYACKNFRETIAEAISLHLTGTKLPKNVVKLVERTISYVKTQM